MALDVHVVSHTHWDREWYLPLERFRQRLVALVDELIDDPPTGHESFLLDGQAIVVEDYLGVRPERRDELRSLLRSGRVEAGPWYVLADELIPSGEALVRNLLTGRRVLRALGAVVPPVLYCPDSFGHPAALPSIAAGFGLPLIILWRGYGGPRWPSGDTVRWAAPNGDQVVMFHLPRDGYEFGSHLPDAPSAAEERWRRMRAELVTRSTTGVMLVQNGADHHARQANAREALGALERAGERDGVHRSSLTRFAESLLQRTASQRLPVVKGELRDSYGYTWTLQGTFATRAHEKRMNAFAERHLLREAEPWAALAAVEGASRRPLLDAAWQTLLAAHPHDTLCGCSIDEVATAMEVRVRSATNQAVGIRDDAIAELTGHDPVEARTAHDRWQPIAQVRNASPRPRGGVAIVELESFVADVPVGPGSAPSGAEAKARDVTRALRPSIPGLGALQLLSQSLENRRTESPRHYPDNDLVAVTRVAAWVAEVPAYGIASYAIDAGEARRSRPKEPVRVGRDEMRNAHLIVHVGGGGLVSLEHPVSGRRVDSLLELIDEADLGDLYTPAPRPRDCTVEFRGVRRIHRGPLRGELELRYIVRGARRRADVEVTLRLVLDADAPFLRIDVDGVNHADDHRLRLRIATGVAEATVCADAAFGTVRREPLGALPADTQMEMPAPTAPLHRYVSLFGRLDGATVFSDGLAEYEANGDGSVIVTLVRAVGELSRNDLPERPGHAGWPTPTPGAQCHGPFAAGLAVMFHGPRLPATLDAIERTADDVLLPLLGCTRRSALTLPPPVHGVVLEGLCLAFSALKESDDGEWLVARCVNLRDDEVAGTWRFPFPLQEARLARLDEISISKVEISGNAVAFRAGPRAIVTLLVR